MTFLKQRETLLAGIILLMVAGIAIRFPGFVAPANLANVLNDTAPLMILVIGQMIVILTKCIDLSVAANLALCGMVAALLNGVSRGDFPPTEQSRQVFERLDGLLQEEMVRFQLIIEQDLARLNELLREEGLDPILVRRLIS